MSEEAKGDAAIDEMERADHIIKWTDILTQGPHAFEKALSKERRHMNPTPIMFAIMEPRSNKVQLAHGFKDIAVDDEEHDANESVGSFLGDRVTVVMDNVPTQHDPPFWTVTTFTKLTSQFKGRETSAGIQQFQEQHTFKHILHHKLEPGAGYDMCHHGISLLAISMRSFAAQERERKDDDDFEMATNNTPEAVRKQTSKAPPPLPATVAELLQLMWRMIILTEGLFTEDCSLATQLRDMHQALQKREQKLMGDPEAAEELIPQLAWAITSTASGKEPILQSTFFNV
jgi:hypothetical protein